MKININYCPIKHYGIMQFIIFKKGDQKYVDGIGHTEDKLVNFDSSWWGCFTPTNCT